MNPHARRRLVGWLADRSVISQKNPIGALFKEEGTEQEIKIIEARTELAQLFCR